MDTRFYTSTLRDFLFLPHDDSFISLAFFIQAATFSQAVSQEKADSCICLLRFSEIFQCHTFFAASSYYTLFFFSIFIFLPLSFSALPHIPLRHTWTILFYFASSLLLPVFLFGHKLRTPNNCFSFQIKNFYCWNFTVPVKDTAVLVVFYFLQNVVYLFCDWRGGPHGDASGDGNGGRRCTSRSCSGCSRSGQPDERTQHVWRQQAPQNDVTGTQHERGPGRKGDWFHIV